MAGPFRAPALDQLRDELDKRWPKRDKKSDGWIGDTAHSYKESDHNPDPEGMVHALDIDDDGIPAQELVDFLVAQHKAGLDNRLWYIIYNRVIWSRTNKWIPRPYNGSNPHTGHIHVSLRYVNSVEANRAPWLTLFGKTDSRYTAWAEVKAGTRTIKLWDSGEDVKELQRVLNAWYKEINVTVDGYFGPGTMEAVVYFQRRAKLEPDGIVGQKSWRALNFIK